MAKPRNTFDRKNPWVVISKERAKSLREEHRIKERATRSDKGTKRKKW